jgi:hypothetical protein
VVDTCEVIARYAPTAATNTGSAGPDPRGCHNAEIRGLASYTIPKIGVLVSGTFRSQPPAQITANWQVPNSAIVAALGHLPPTATATGTSTLALTDNEHRVYAGERRSQIDVRLAKILRFGRSRADIGVDVTNLLNANYATGFNQTYIYNTDNVQRPGGWGAPTSIYTPRFVRFNFTLNF